MRHRIPYLLAFSLLFFQISFATTGTDSCAIYGDTSVCENESQSYSAGYSGTYQYTWGVFGGTIVGGNTNPTVNVNWGFPGSGQVTLIVKDSVNTVLCTKVINVTIHPTPKPVITASFQAMCPSGMKDNPGGEPDHREDCNVVCDSTWVTYTVPLNAGSTYSWIINGSTTFTTSGNTASVYWDVVGVGTVKVIETNAAGCVGMTEICIDIIPSPTAIFTTIPAAVAGIINICKNSSVFFDNASVDNGGKPIYSYEWDFGDGNSQTLTAPTTGDVSHTYTTAGTYTAWLVVTNECGCVDSTSVIVVVDSTEGPDIFCVSTVCPGSAVTYSTNAICTTYNWTVMNGSFTGPSNTQTVTVQWTGTSPAVIGLSVPCGSYCPSPTTLVVPVIPTNATYTGDTTICEGDCGELRIDCAIPIDSIVWHVPSQITLTTDTINLHRIGFCGYGGLIDTTIWVEYFHNTNGSVVDLECGGNLYIPIHVRPKFNLFGPTDYCENQAFAFNSFTSLTTTMQWTIRNSSGTIVSSSILPTSSTFTGSWIWGPGTYILTLGDINNEHCNETERLIITVNPSPSPPTIIGEDTICPSKSYSYTGIASNVLHTISWSVTGGSPSTGSGSSMNVTWNPSGPYSISATVIDQVSGCESLPTTLSVQSFLPLAPSVIVGPDTVCSNGTSNYSTATVGTNYEWSINPTIAGSIGTGQYSNAVQIQWNNYTGNAWVVVKRTNCSQSRKDSILVYVQPAPVPSILAPDSICENASFTLTAVGSGSSYAWDFGDGNNSTGVSTSHTYTNPGTYVITLTASFGGSCPVNASTTKNIKVIPAPVVNITTADPTKYCNPPPPFAVNMVIASSLGTTSCNWYQSPSTTSISTASTYTATSLGSYYVICTNAAGCSTTSDPIVIDTIPCDNCTPENYSLGFSIDRLGCNTDSFTYSSTNVSGHSWNFGDNFNPGTNSASGNNVTHTYTEPGAYSIELCGLVPDASTSSNDSCLVCRSITDTINYIPDFYPIINCTDYSPSYTVTFKNTTKVYSLAPPPSYAWSINSGSTLSTSTDFTTTLSPGTYVITMTISGVCSYSQTITIVAPTQASFTASDSVCVGAPVQFTNTSSPILGQDWNFGDGATSLLYSPLRSYSTAGTFTTTLTIVNQYGCKDSSQKPIVVLPNTLTASLSLSGPNSFCFGDSVDITVIPSGGYNPYSYLWTTTAATPTITAKFTGNYGVDVYDSKGCFYKVPDTLVLVNPIPNATITGDTSWCYGSTGAFIIASPNAGHSFSYVLDGVTQPPWYLNTYYYNALTAGSHWLAVTVTNSFGCSATDTIYFNVYNLPNVSIAYTGPLCEGDTNVLVGQSTSTNLIDSFWSTGLHKDTLITKIPNTYSYTVVDNNGCENEALVLVHRLPDLCGMMTGCYEICDTVTQLVWYAPKGYAMYQWYFNGIPITGATSDTIHIPLYQSGDYTVLITNTAGCSILSDPIEIEFVPCATCNLNASISIHCGPINANGHQTYNLSISLTSSLPTGASISISSPDGTITGLSPSTVANGLNTFTAVFTDIPPVGDSACFTIAIWDQNDRCDTTICLRLPPCKNNQCEVTMHQDGPFKCIGYDGSGNPQYYGCINVNWAGAGGALLTINAPNSGFTPSSFPLVNGSNTVCFTYTDFPPLNPSFLQIYTYIYDSVSQTNCCDSIVIDYKPCPRECSLDVTGLCAHCEDQLQNGNWVYKIEMDVTNPFSVNGNVSIVPIPEGTFGPISPNPIPPGTTTISTLFSDLGAMDTLICFRVVVTNSVNGDICYRDLCIALPPCKGVNIQNLANSNELLIYPNPSTDYLTLQQRGIVKKGIVRISSTNGNTVSVYRMNSATGSTTLDIKSLAKGMYLIEFLQDDGVVRRSRMIKQ